MGQALVALVLGCLVSTSPAYAADITPSGTVKAFEIATEPKAPAEFTWRDANGNETSLNAYAGKTIVMNFWATWCAPCITELPSLQRLQEKLGNAPIVVVAMNIDRGVDGASKAQAMLRRLKLDELAFHHDGQSQVYRAESIEVMPTTIVFDSQGREAGRLRGPAEWDAPEAIKLLRALSETPKR